MSNTKKEKTKHLGRGLESLLGPVREVSQSYIPPIPITAVNPKPFAKNNMQDELQMLSLTQISPNPYQPRQVWDEVELAELAESIKANGVIQPVIVRENKGSYELIAGERRLRAAQQLCLDKIPAIIRKATDEQLMELALVENIHRTNLNAIERAQAYQNYLSTFSLTQAEAAERLGENRSVIANHLRLLDLPIEIKQIVNSGKLSMGHARAILALPNDELRRKLANKALAGRLSVREVERLVKRYLSASGENSQRIRIKPAYIIDLEQRLTGELGTKVNIETRKDGQRGKITIEFYSLDDFERLAEKMGLNIIDEV